VGCGGGAANVAANSPLIAGEYVADDLEALLRELRLDENHAGGQQGAGTTCGIAVCP
jgi:hypothetical protein